MINLDVHTDAGSHDILFLSGFQMEFFTITGLLITRSTCALAGADSAHPHNANVTFGFAIHFMMQRDCDVFIR